MHFSEEESLIFDHEYPGYDDHRLAHRELSRKIENMNAGIEAENVRAEFILGLARDLHDWFVKHIQGFDQELGVFLQAKARYEQLHGY
jgi:hemerythrin